MSDHRLNTFDDRAPAAAVMALGAGNQLGQVLVLRELLMVFHGHELTIGIIIAAWMAWEAAGSWIGALVAERTARAPAVLKWLVAFAVFTLPATLILIRALRGLFNAVPGAHLSLRHTVLSCFAVMAPICMLQGAQFVLLARRWRECLRTEDMSGAVRTYIVEALGHMAGGLLFSLFLVHFLSPLQTAAVFGIVMLGGIRFLLPARSAERRIFAGLLLLFAALIPFLKDADALAFRLQWRHFLPGSVLVETRPSKYGRINVARRNDQYSFFQSNHLMFSTGGPEIEITGFEELEASCLVHLTLSQHENPGRVLLVGGGMRGVLRELLRYEGLRVDYIELDRELISAAYPYLPGSTRRALHDERTRVLTLDGRIHVKTARERYDVVIVDLPDPATAVLNRFYTKEFFREVSDRLKQGGVFAISATSTPGLRHSAIVNRNATIYHTLREVFEDVLATGEDVCLFFASGKRNHLTSDAAVLSERYRGRGVESPDFSDRHFSTLLRDNHIRRKNWILSRHGRCGRDIGSSPDTGPLFPPGLERQRADEASLPAVYGRFFVNTDFRPIGYYHTLILLDIQSGHGAADLLQGLLQIRLWWVALAALILTAACLALRLFFGGVKPGPAGGYAAGYSVFAVGFSSMTFEVALIFAFQSIYGYVFEQIGLIVALFMGGLALGCALSERFVPGKERIHTMAAVQALFVVFAFLLIASVRSAAVLRTPQLIFCLFSACTFAAGMLNGMHYPLAGAFRRRMTGRAERSAGFIYAIELVGACLGAVVSSLALIPVLGLAGACLAAGIFNLAAIVIISISGVRPALPEGGTSANHVSFLGDEEPQMNTDKH